MLSIDEAINILKSDIKYNKSIGCDTSYEEQLAEWMEELKALRNGLKIKCDSLNEALEKGKKVGYNKAIDDFIAKCENAKFAESDEIALSDIHAGVNSGLSMAIHFAEQLKAGE